MASVPTGSGIIIWYYTLTMNFGGGEMVCRIILWYIIMIVTDGTIVHLVD